MPRNQKFLILVVLFVLLSVSFASGALEVSDVTLSPTILWLHKNPDLTISAKCALDGVILPNATVKADIYPPSSNVPLTSPSLAYDQNSERYKKTFQASFSATGTYTVKVTCSYQAGSATAQENFIGNKLELRIINDIGNPADAYMGGKLSLHVELLRNNALVSPSQDTFEVWVGKEKLSVISLPIIDGKYQKIEVKIPLDPAELTVGVYDLKVNAKYEGSNVESALDDVIRVNTPLTMDVTDEKVKCPAGLACSESVNAKVVFHDGDIGDFTADKNFQALLKDGKKWITVYVSDVQCNAVSESCI
ncbi:MAG: hypothetical protein JXB14_05630, partial [Candidatus Altiarchaeota archaeon]|nr:hypothetical protein [Candidatus Altiarchaeota archaeon]